MNKIGVCPRPRGALVLWEEVTPLAKLMCKRSHLSTFLKEVSKASV